MLRRLIIFFAGSFIISGLLSGIIMVSIPDPTSPPTLSPTISPTQIPSVSPTKFPTLSPIVAFNPQISSKLGNIVRFETNGPKFDYTGNQRIGIYCTHFKNEPACSIRSAENGVNKLKNKMELASAGLINITTHFGRRRVAPGPVFGCPGGGKCGFCRKGYSPVAGKQTARWSGCTAGQNMAHEMGHTFRLYHAGQPRYTSYSKRNFALKRSKKDRTFDRYGDRSSAMGVFMSSHDATYNIHQLYHLGWYYDGEIKHIERGRTTLYDFGDVKTVGYVPKLRGLVFDDPRSAHGPNVRYWVGIVEDTIMIWFQRQDMEDKEGRFYRETARVNWYFLKEGNNPYKYGEIFTCPLTGLSFKFISGSKKQGYVLDIDWDENDRIALKEENHPAITIKHASVKKGSNTRKSQTRVTLRLGQTEKVNGEALPTVLFQNRTAIIKSPNGVEFIKSISFNKCIAGYGYHQTIGNRLMPSVQMVIDDDNLGSKPKDGIPTTGWTYKYGDLNFRPLNVKFY